VGLKAGGLETGGCRTGRRGHEHHKECPFPTHDAERDDDERKPDDRQDDQKWARELERQL
jgi:hypothetical protein